MTPWASWTGSTALRTNATRSGKIEVRCALRSGESTLPTQLAQLIIPALVAFAVVALTHFFTVRRETESKRREQRVGYLVAAYRGLSKANNHPRLWQVADELDPLLTELRNSLRKELGQKAVTGRVLWLKVTREK